MNIDKIAILIKKAALEAEKVQMPILQSHDLSVAQYKLNTCTTRRGILSASLTWKHIIP